MSLSIWIPCTAAWTFYRMNVNKAMKRNWCINLFRIVVLYTVTLSDVCKDWKLCITVIVSCWICNVNRPQVPQICCLTNTVWIVFKIKYNNCLSNWIVHLYQTNYINVVMRINKNRWFNLLCIFSWYNWVFYTCEFSFTRKLAFHLKSIWRYIFFFTYNFPLHIVFFPCICTDWY